MYKNYLIYAGISLGVSALVGYYFYQKYKPLIGVANETNTIIGEIEDGLGYLWGELSGNGVAGTTGIM